MRIKPWLRKKINISLYETLVQELRFEDKSEYKKLLRMTPKHFDEIFGCTYSRLHNQNKHKYV